MIRTDSQQNSKARLTRISPERLIRSIRVRRDREDVARVKCTGGPDCETNNALLILLEECKLLGNAAKIVRQYKKSVTVALGRLTLSRTTRCYLHRSQTEGLGGCHSAVAT